MENTSELIQFMLQQIKALQKENARLQSVINILIINKNG